MAEPTGKLSQIDKDKIVEWVNTRSKFHNCPSCGDNNWTVGDDLLNMMPYNGGNLVLGGPAYPAAFLVCNHCAYVRQYMAVPMGLLASSSEGERENG